ncbi:MAG TPA: proline--tRNA ligase, partial [Gammaproteobacteria bacterium]|nr:proline--tRNA ligase [Gammaproteobacteria bacterium]
YTRAKSFREQNTAIIKNKDEFYEYFAQDKSGFALAHWNGSKEVEAKIKNDLSVTIRCIPFDEKPEPGQCIFTGEASKQRVIWAKSY